MNRQEWATKFRTGKVPVTSFGGDYGIDYESPDTAANRPANSMVAQMEGWGTGRPVSSAAGDVEDVGITVIEPEVRAKIQQEGDALLMTDPPISGGKDSTLSEIASAVASPVMTLESIVTPVSTPIVQRPLTQNRPAPAPAPLAAPRAVQAGFLSGPTATRDLMIVGGVGAALLVGAWLWNREGR